jgi:septum formation topological specificity factor MinE
MNKDKILALAKYFNIEEEDVLFYRDQYTANEQDFYVYSTDELHEIAEGQERDYLSELLSDLPSHLHKYFDIDKYLYDVIDDPADYIGNGNGEYIELCGDDDNYYAFEV